ncbi:putative glycolipid-binding domain-containing protein [Microvirga pudoricolor]|uniref:putative glycolipid-binding domain-containing protein n=1 Tax=Microvirga pudoricolor TaxID=2778729 RepID=UPI001950C383|nr:putative glycolipid-binding domain-containing protein [Microvirga pudoricolor]MBM6596569.1 putative glycolipid-binding domain-containing protein [Microvirga pudoricolor]
MTSTLIFRSIRWSAWEGCEAGMEQADVSPAEGGLDVAGVVIGTEDGTRFGLSYRLRLDALWHVREATLWTTSGKALRLLSNGRGSWQVDGREEPGLQGCIDIDIQATPLTNTLPIRRLDMKPGDAVEVRLCYVGVPNLTVSPRSQRYTALESGLDYRFESLDSGFTADLPVDRDGFVLDYPGLFRRLD